MRLENIKQLEPEQFYIKYKCSKSLIQAGWDLLKRARNIRKSYDAMETSPVTPPPLKNPQKNTFILKRVKFHEDDMRESNSDVTL